MENLRIDETDIKILKHHYTAEQQFTTTDLTKWVHPQIKTYSELQDKNANMNKRMAKLSRYGFLDCIKEGRKSFYKINPDTVVFSRGELRMQGKNKEKINLIFEDVMALKPNGSWIAYQIR